MYFSTKTSSSSPQESKENKKPPSALDQAMAATLAAIQVPSAVKGEFYSVVIYLLLFVVVLDKLPCRSPLCKGMKWV